VSAFGGMSGSGLMCLLARRGGRRENCGVSGSSRRVHDQPCQRRCGATCGPKPAQERGPEKAPVKPRAHV
jgi:hypothetical protein